jgi:hypothetical protein
VTPRAASAPVAMPGLLSWPRGSGPARIFNKRVAFSKACGRVESGTYVIKLWKEKALDRSGDGWQIAGSGTLTTK